MASHGRSGVLLVILATVALLLVAGCKGFFVNPSLTAISVSSNLGPTPTITAETPGPPPTCPAGSVCTVQMVANGTFSDGSTSTVSASWSLTSVSPAGAVTITPGGLVTGVMPGSGTVQAASGTLTSSTTVTVACAGLQPTLQINPSNSSATLATGSQQFKATGTCSSGMVDLTGSATWTSSDPTVLAFNTGTNGKAAFLKAGGPITITATVTGTTTASGMTQFTVNP